MNKPYFFGHSHHSVHSHNPGKMTHIHPHVELVYCRDGAGYQITPTGLKRMVKGDLFCFLPGESHLSYCETGEELDLWVVYFEEELFFSNPEDRHWYGIWRQRREDSLSRKISVKRELAGECGKAMERIVYELSNSQPGNRSAARSRLVLMLTALLRQGTGEREDEAVLTARERIDNLLLFLEVNYHSPLTVEDARRFCLMSRSHFHTLFREKTECGFTVYLNRLRIDRAGDLLRSHRDLSVTETAESCGFGEMSHFCHLFKRFKGCSPRQWRSSLPIGKEEEPL